MALEDEETRPETTVKFQTGEEFSVPSFISLRELWSYLMDEDISPELAQILHEIEEAGQELIDSDPSTIPDLDIYVNGEKVLPTFNLSSDEELGEPVRIRIEE